MSYPSRTSCFRCSSSLLQPPKALEAWTGQINDKLRGSALSAAVAFYLHQVYDTEGRCLKRGVTLAQWLRVMKQARNRLEIMGKWRCSRLGRLFLGGFLRSQGVRGVYHRPGCGQRGFDPAESVKKNNFRKRWSRVRGAVDGSISGRQKSSQASVAQNEYRG